ncbi:DUF262 domain-containing HNH endonuclease family protein [Henriciella sp.]|uniref:DUF262 domain-containing protein n=1 Tax=Henriciella sp. TaxID=1968823 RepID=UPI00262D3E5D|nr:DUF262 domain-containing HNH endonuclease family protein [Henriciella sp.]
MDSGLAYLDSGIRARECGLSEILSPGHALKMPPYQRSYSWEENEVRELVDDLLNASETGRYHFMGAVVLVGMEDHSFQVVDGQQRLTTLTMILATLRDLETDPLIRSGIHNLIGDPARPLLGESAVWRLTLNDVDNPFFREAVQTDGATRRRDIETSAHSNHEGMQKNLTFLDEILSALSIEARRNLFYAVRDRIVLVRVVVPDWDGGYDVFRVLNTRGKAPNSHDIIKTEILQHANFSVEEAGHYAREWLDHEAALGGGGLDELLHIIRQLYSRNTKGKTANVFAKAVLSRVDPRTFIDSELPLYVEAYRVILRGDTDLGEYNEQLRATLNHLRLLDHQIWRVPAVAYLYHYPGNGVETLRFFQLLERLAFAMMLNFTTAGARQKRYQKLTQLILNGKPLFEKSSPLRFSKDERKKVRERMMGRYATFGQRRAIVLRVNAALENGEAITLEDDATVEHVLPRAVPDGSYWNTTWPNLHVQRELCETLGNFVIVPQQVNHRADRLDFREKKKIFFGDGARVFALTEDLRHRNTWTPEDVRARTAQLVDIMMDVWFDGSGI